MSRLLPCGKSKCKNELRYCLVCLLEMYGMNKNVSKEIKDEMSCWLVTSQFVLSETVRFEGLQMDVVCSFVRCRGFPYKETERRNNNNNNIKNYLLLLFFLLLVLPLLPFWSLRRVHGHHHLFCSWQHLRDEKKGDPCRGFSLFSLVAVEICLDQWIDLGRMLKTSPHPINKCISMSRGNKKRILKRKREKGKKKRIDFHGRTDGLEVC